jgi:hypothetical protein
MIGNNSIVYVEPRASKAYRLAIDNYLPMINAISSISGTLLNINTLKRNSFYFGTDGGKSSSNTQPSYLQQVTTTPTTD